MGLMDKLKGLFYEDVPEEHIEENNEEKAEEKQTKEEKLAEDELENVISERELFKSETTFKFPVKFEDDEVESMDSLNVMDKIKEEPTEEEKPKMFRPTPIVSPVYGILDKHYEKDHLPDKAKGKLVTIEKEEKKLSVDDIRKKAFGTLEDDLEKTMTDEVELFDLEPEEEVPELTRDLKEDISLEASKVTIGDAEENFDDFGIEYDPDKLSDEILEVEPEEKKESEGKEDLFDMIDSMYEEEKEGDEE